MSYDVIIIGGGHNGLICAAYLAKAGLSVCVFEKRLEIGGGLSTEEATEPGFYHNLHSVFHDAVEHMPAMADLALAAHGAEYILPPVQVGLAFTDGRALTVHTDHQKTRASLARFSERDARAWMALKDDYGEFMSTIVIPALYAPPPTPSEQTMALERTPEGLAYLRLSRQSPEDVVRELFESDAAQAAALFQLAVPRGAITDSAGLGMLVPLVVSQVERSHLAKGGSHAIAHALWRVVLKAGGSVRGTREVTRIVVEGGRASAVELASGERIAAKKAIVSAIDLKQTFLRLLSPGALDPAFVESVKTYKLDEFSLFGVHLALEEAPRYRATAFDPDLDRAFKIGIGFERTEDFAALWHDVRRGALPEQPKMYVCCPSLHDPSQAPPGRHTAFLWAVVPYALRDGGAAAWDRVGPAYAERCLATWAAEAPNLTGSNILAKRVLSPLDIERKLQSMPRGGVFHGRLSLDQIERFRPLPVLADASTPVAGLYLAGASLHPGGGILGACGYIAAQKICADLGVARWWS